MKGAPTRRLGEVATLVGGGTPSRSNPDYFVGDVPWVTPTDLPPVGTVRLLGPVSGRINNAGLKNSSARLLTPGTVLFSSRATIGKIAIADRVCATNQGFCNFVPKTDALDPWYLAYYLAFSIDEIVALAGATTFKEVSRSKLGAFEVPLPGLVEQRRIATRIAACLERVHEIHSQRLDAEREANALLPSSLAAVFDDLAKRYGEVALDKILSETRYGTSQKCDAGVNATPILRIPNVAHGQISLENLKYCALSNVELSRLALAPGDLLLVRTNGSADLVGRCAVFEGASRPIAFASYLIRMRVADAADPHFLAFFLSSTSGRDAIASIRRTSAGQYNVNSENLRGIRIPLPPVEEQRRIANRLRGQQDVVRCLIREQAARLGDTEQLRLAVLRKAFAGEL